MVKNIAVFLLAICLVACTTKQKEENKEKADIIYYGGPILTMEFVQPVVEAIAIRDGKIVALGKEADVSELISETTPWHDLEGKTMMPGFIDGHSHLAMNALKKLAADISPKTADNSATIDQMVDKLKAAGTKTSREKNPWIIGWGYDQTKLAENRHPTASDLDKVSLDRPVVAVHFSGHEAVVNSKGLEVLGYTKDSEDPPGGHITKNLEDGTPTGLIEESAWSPLVFMAFSRDIADRKTALKASLEDYARAGFTTVQEGALLDPLDKQALTELAAKGDVPIDVILFPLKDTNDFSLDDVNYTKDYTNNLRVGGVKIMLDGTTTGRTAFLREPYFTQHEGESDYRGYPHEPDQDHLNRILIDAYKRKIPMNIHAVGDAAIDMAIWAIQAADNATPPADQRTNLVHLQTIRQDQLNLLKILPTTTSFQLAHNYYFGDLDKERFLGPERAEKLAPLKSAQRRKMHMSIHHDAPAHPIDQFTLIYAATSRKTQSGQVIGEDEKITVHDALKMSTIFPAYQYFEEDSKGSFKVGKVADMIVLDKNPEHTPITDMRSIQVIETYKAGKLIYSRKP